MLHDDRSRGPDLARSIDLVRRDVVAGYLADDGGQAGRVPGNRSVGRQADEAVECVVGKSIAGDADADLSDQQRADVEHRADRRAVALRLSIAIRSELRELR